MPSSKSHDAWLAHLQQLLALREQRHGVLTAEDVREIALEIGLSDADLRAADEAAKRCLQRGRGYLERKLWDDAIGELTEAVALAPADPDVHAALAGAYGGRYLDQRGAADGEAAERLAKLSLELDPENADAFEVLAKLRGDASRSRSPLTALRGWRLLAVVLGVGLVVGGLALRASTKASDPASAPKSDFPAPLQTPPRAPSAARATGSASASLCAEGMRFDHDRGCFKPSIVVVPGEGVQGIVVGRSSPEDVLGVFGRDAQVSRHSDGEVFSIDYAYDEHGQHDASRRANHKRPGSFDFKRGVLQKISVGVYQQDLVTPGGLHTDSTKADMLREFGEDYEFVPGDPLETYIYRSRGIDMYVDDKGEINSFRIRVPEAE